MTTIRKALPVVLLAVVALWTFQSHHGPLSSPPAVYAQSPQDCSFTFNFTGSASSQTIPNLSGNTPCVVWRVTFSTTATLAATVTFNTSPDGITWTAVPNTICSSSVQPPCILQGTNPLTGTQQGMGYFSVYGNAVNVSITTTGAGTGTVRVYGVKGASASAGSVGGGGGGTQTSIFSAGSAVQRYVQCAVGTTGTADLSGLPAGASGEITIQTGIAGTVRWQGIRLSETTQFTGTGLTVSMGRPGSTTHAEMTNGLAFPLGVSSGDVNYITTRPIPPQLTTTYSVVLNFAVTAGNVNASTGSLTWELCGYAAL